MFTVDSQFNWHWYVFELFAILISSFNQSWAHYYCARPQLLSPPPNLHPSITHYYCLAIFSSNRWRIFCSHHHHRLILHLLFPPWPSLAYPLWARRRSFLMALEWQYTDTDNDGIFILQTSGGDYLSVKSVRQGLVGVWTVVDLGYSTDRDQAVLVELVSEYLWNLEW